MKTGFERTGKSSKERRLSKRESVCEKQQEENQYEYREVMEEQKFLNVKAIIWGKKDDYEKKNPGFRNHSLNLL